MEIQPKVLYHIYNQGNNREQIFYSHENYLFFLNKYRQYVAQHCNTLSFCLMPDHFHFLIYTNQESVTIQKSGGIQMSAIANGFRLLLSRFAQSINKQECRTGSLFRQKTQAKWLDTKQTGYGLTCFQYIHQNPLRAKLVDKMEDWEFSSFRDYANLRKGTLCDKLHAQQLLNYHESNFYEESYQPLDPYTITHLFS